MTIDGQVSDNPELQQFELVTDGQIALAAYERKSGSIVFTHTEVPAALEGHGVGSRLIAGALSAARRDGLKVVPACSFVRAYIERHSEEQDLLA